MGKKKIFISHSSANLDIAENICTLLYRLGINERDVFCSSIIGQGVDNGKKLNEAIFESIKKSKLIIYLLSKDFINSSYCMEELGMGWYLSHNKKATCFYLVLPDVELSEIKGFVNSSIQKFTFIDNNHPDDINLLIENLRGILHKKSLGITRDSNIVNNFFSSTKASLENLVKTKKECVKEELKKDQKIKELQEQLEKRIDEIKQCKNIIESQKSETEKEKLLIELQAIESNFFILGITSGISKQQFKTLYKNFWFDMVNRYNDLIATLNTGPRNANMEMLISTIYAANNVPEKALFHLKNFIVCCTSNIYIMYFKNFFECYTGSMKEIIDLLQEKANQESEGIVKDSYISTIEKLLEREKKISNNN